MKKYLIPASLLLLHNEVLSLIALCIIVWMGLGEFICARIKEVERK